MWTFKRARAPVNYRFPALIAVGGGLCLLAGYYGAKLVLPQTPPKKVEAPVVVVQKPTCVAHSYTATAAADRKHGLTGIAEREFGGRGYFWPVLAEVNHLKN